jgi:hypothetical protein
LTSISVQNEILVIQSIIYFVAASIPIYLAFIAKTKMHNSDGNNHFKRLTVVLASFVLMQGIYHVVNYFGYKVLAKGVLEPLSFSILILFGSFYIISRVSTKAEALRKVK